MNGRKGFTLIELLIVIAIILILIAIALPNFLEAQVRARLANTRACLQTYRTANEAYQTDFKMYPPDVDGGETVKGTGIQWSTVLLMRRGLNCDNVGELCTFALLTSPIRYLTELCYDPFLQQQNDPQAGKRYSLPEYTTYLSGGTFRKQSGDRFGLRYVILSRGPDLLRDAGDYEQLWFDLGSHRHHVTGNPRIYSPTNGTKSRGDLVVSNRGHEGP
ncbi:MAG: prepilin-type N-terminal cleavage/methylation domain-containing protein [Candidatus Omnitrophica bacterium]|nr:prepilin-type N-terminal cleavage/methylation domain-containing protein [Candidatus Omnitrophota bacterium]